MKEVSVVMTTYMHGKYIRAAVKSVLGQTFGDYELIIIDDGSPDNTAEEVSNVRDKRIKYIRQEPSGLPANARNRGIKEAGGRLIAFFDGDDYWHPNKLARCLEVFDRDRSVDILCHDVDLLSANDEKVFKRTFFGPYEDDMYGQLLLKGNALFPTSTVARRSIFSEDGFSFSEDKNLFTVEDYDLWLRLAKSGSYNFFYLPRVLGRHRVFEGSASRAHIETQALNTLYLFDKNLKGLDLKQGRLRQIIKKRKSQIMLGAGLAFNYRRKFSESVRWNIKAIGEYPLYPKPYFALLASLCRLKLGYL